MAEAGYFAQKRGSPTGFGLVVLGHAALIAAVIMIKGPAVTRYLNPPTIVDFIEVEDDPPPVQPPETRQPEQETRFTRPTREVDIPVPAGPAGPTADTRPIPEPTPRSDETIELARVETITPAIRREAEILSGNLQPPYPAVEQRADRGGMVRLRVHIGENGRVSAVERLSATSEAFWSATQRHALSRWRFRPATVDGRPVESSKTMTVHFRIEDL